MPVVRHGYFTVQVRVEGPESPTVTGVLENLATGDKVAFDSSEELARLVRSWADAQVVDRGAPAMLPRTRIGAGEPAGTAPVADVVSPPPPTESV